MPLLQQISAFTLSTIKKQSSTTSSHLPQYLLEEAKSFQQNRKFDESIAAAKRVLALKEITEEQSLMAIFILAGSYGKKGHIEEALAFSKEALTLAEKLNNFSLICKLLDFIGTCYKIF